MTPTTQVPVWKSALIAYHRRILSVIFDSPLSDSVEVKLPVCGWRLNARGYIIDSDGRLVFERHNVNDVRKAAQLVAALEVYLRLNEGAAGR